VIENICPSKPLKHIVETRKRRGKEVIARRRKIKCLRIREHLRISILVGEMVLKLNKVSFQFTTRAMNWIFKKGILHMLRCLH
jgi:hypothetical protein